MIKKRCRFLFLCLPLVSVGAWAQTLDLESAIQTALSKNPGLQAAELKAQSEHADIRLQYAPENPMVGFEYEKNLNPLEIQDGPMKLWSISQNLQFPIKYFKLASIQKSRAEQADTESSLEKLRIRQKTVSAFYKAFTQGRILALLKANLESARKTSRTAELKHSTGQVPQQDEMKAHVEETRINTEMILADEEYQAAQAELNALLGQDPLEELLLPTQELTVPKLKLAAAEIPKLAEKTARPILSADLQIREAQERKTLAALNFLPDFKLSYKRAFGNTMMPDAYAFGVELSLPLWFPLRESSALSSARLSAAQAQNQGTQARLETRAQSKSLATRAHHHQILLEIYETSLIPQATATFNSSTAAYRAGKVSLLELLDSQRALYQTKIAFYRTLAEYTAVISELEALAGASVSNLPFPAETL